MVNMCMVGHGMMGIWHSQALKRVPDRQLHTVVGRAKYPTKDEPVPAAGRRPSSTEESASKYGFKKRTTNLDEWGQLPIPKKLLAKGVRYIVRISDARTRGTSNAACVLHVARESSMDWPFALVQHGDIIQLDVAARGLNLNVPDDELAKRRAEWQQSPHKFSRGYGALYLKHITRTNEDCDFDFLESGAPTPEPQIH